MSNQETLENLPNIIEALLFASEKPLTLAQLDEIINLNETPVPQTEAPIEETNEPLPEETAAAPIELEIEHEENPSAEPLELTQEQIIVRIASESQILDAIDKVKSKYNENTTINPVSFVEIGDGYHLRTNPHYSTWLKRLKIARPVKLTKSALETLAILAYKQPMTKAEVDAIRGVDSGYSIRFLLEKKLSKILGKKEIPGKPIIYGTTNEFLSLFGLKNLSSLPTLREFRELTEKHAEKVKELFSEPTMNELKEQAQALTSYSDDDAKDLAQIDEVLSQTRKIKTVDQILKHQLFQNGEQENIQASNLETSDSAESVITQDEPITQDVLLPNETAAEPSETSDQDYEG